MYYEKMVGMKVEGLIRRVHITKVEVEILGGKVALHKSEGPMLEKVYEKFKCGDTVQCEIIGYEGSTIRINILD